MIGLVCITIAATAPSLISDASPIPSAPITTAKLAQTETAKPKVPNGVQSDMIVLAVDKSTLEAELRTWPSNTTQSSVLKTYKIATGKAEGDKQVEGDNRTPEGIYFALEHIPGESLPEKYGAQAIPIDFPNPIDRVQKKTGYGIWLHGVDREARIEEAKVTEGCVAFYNQDIAKLGSWLRPNQGVVVIAKNKKDINRPEDIETVTRLTKNWMKAWADRDMSSYISYYSPDFRYNHHDRDSYKSYKTRVFRSYKKMIVNLTDLRVIAHSKYAISMFNQDFYGDKRFQSIGRKKLYWIKNEHGQWQIMDESFEQRRFEFLTFTDAELALLSGSSSSIPSDKEKTAQSL